MTLHEQFRDEKHSGSTNRSFGIVFTIVFSLVAAYLAWHDNQWFIPCAALATLFLLATLVYADSLAPLNRAWTWFGLQLGKFMTPIILLLLFLVCFLPTGLIARMSGKDFLRLKRTGAASYWIARDGRSAEQTNLKNQF